VSFFDIAAKGCFIDKKRGYQFFSIYKERYITDGCINNYVYATSKYEYTLLSE
jgi:hypothetical protein